MVAQRLAITERLIAEEYPEVGDFQKLIDAALQRVHDFSSEFEYQLVECEDIDTVVAAIEIFDGSIGYDDKARVVLLPDLRMLGLERLIYGTHGISVLDRKFVLWTAQRVHTFFTGRFDAFDAVKAALTSIVHKPVN